jgi:hypothetical protein
MQIALNNGEELVIDIVMMTRQYSFWDSPISFANVMIDVFLLN